MATLGLLLLHGLLVAAEQKLFSSYDEQASYCSGLSCLQHSLLGLVGSIVMALSPAARGTFPDRNHTCVPCIGRWLLST